MTRYIKFTLFIFFFFNPNNLLASTKNKIIQNFVEIKNLSFEFKQNINEETEQGECVIEYPKKIFCEYDNLKQKILDLQLIEQKKAYSTYSKTCMTLKTLKY